MELKNGYKILYEKIKNNNSSVVEKGYATKGLPDDTSSKVVSLIANDSLADKVNLSDYSLIYQKGNTIYGSKSYLPTDNDDVISVIDSLDNLVLGVNNPAPAETFVVMVAYIYGPIEALSVTSVERTSSSNVKVTATAKSALPSKSHCVVQAYYTDDASRTITVKTFSIVRNTEFTANLTLPESSGEHKITIKISKID